MAFTRPLGAISTNHPLALGGTHRLRACLQHLPLKRFLAVFYPSAEYLLTTRITRVAQEPFKTEGKVLVSPGWLAVYGKEAQSDIGASLAYRRSGRVADRACDPIDNPSAQGEKQ